jgi:hypothetical protein
MPTMKFKLGDIVYFIPTYYAETKLGNGMCFYQVIHFDEKRDAYLVMGFDLYCPTAPEHFYRAYVKESDLDFQKNIKEKSGLPDNIVMFEDDKIKLFKTSHLVDIYEGSRIMIDYVKHEKEYPNIYDYLLKFNKNN